MESFKENEPSGSLQISQDVVCTIASVAAQEIDGVVGLVQHTPGFRFGPLRKSRRNMVDVALSDDFAEIDIGVALKYGAKVTETCTAIQNCVKSNVQTMTGMAVSKVNVYVARIVFPDDEPEEA